MQSFLKKTYESIFLGLKFLSRRPLFNFSNQLNTACFKPYKDLFNFKTYLLVSPSGTPTGTKPQGNSIKKHLHPVWLVGKQGQNQLILYPNCELIKQKESSH